MHEELNITEFLLARIAEDEAAAGSYLRDPANSIPVWRRMVNEWVAKRAIVESHQPVKDVGWDGGESHDHLWCAACGSLDDAPVAYPCPTIRALARVYSDHPEYQEGWLL